MQCSSLIPILLLVLDLAQCIWMKLSALAVRVTSPIALEALLSAALLSTRMQEYDVKVWRNYVKCVVLKLSEGNYVI